MSIKALMNLLPKFTTIVGEKWLRSNSHAMEKYISERLLWFKQLENDLSLLGKQVSERDLILCYRSALCDCSQVQKAIYEVHGVAILSSIATKTELHVPRDNSSNRNFDVRVNIQGFVINAESKTRKDEFPFNLPSSGNFYAGSRPTLDPHDSSDLGIESTKHASDIKEIRNPESTVIRQCLIEGLGQLPRDGCNIIIFGHIEGDRLNLEDALHGSVVVEVVRNLETKEYATRWVRTPTGAFNVGSAGEPFLSLSAILWTRLLPSFNNELIRAYKLYLNPNALHPLPNKVKTALEHFIKERSSPEIRV